MGNALAELLERLSAEASTDESMLFEFKAAAGGVPNSMWQTVSAFANTSGGWILLGVAEGPEGKPVVQGVPDVRQRRLEIWTNLRNPAKLSAIDFSEHDVRVEQADGKDIIVVRVPRAPRENRPVYINGNRDQGTYIRRDSGDFRCSTAEIDRMVREATPQPADAEVVHHFGLHDLDRDSLLQYRRRYRIENDDDPANGYEDQEFLATLGGWRLTRGERTEGLTVAGLLMFGSESALSEWRGRHAIDFRQLPGSIDEPDTWLDRVFFEGNLFQAFLRLQPLLTRDLPAPFRLEGSVGKFDSPLTAALREALINLLIHTDYRESTPR